MKKYHIQKNGTKILITDMTDDHLKNTMNTIHRLYEHYGDPKVYVEFEYKSYKNELEFRKLFNNKI
jgi:ribosome-associated translation inhibitor RaiA